MKIILFLTLKKIECDHNLIGKWGRNAAAKWEKQERRNISWRSRWNSLFLLHKKNHCEISTYKVEYQVKLTWGLSVGMWSYHTMLFQPDVLPAAMWGKLAFSCWFCVIKSYNVLRKEHVNQCDFWIIRISCRYFSVAIISYLFVYDAMHCWKTDCICS